MTINKLMMELDMVLCDISLQGDEEAESLRDRLVGRTGNAFEGLAHIAEIRQRGMT